MFEKRDSSNRRIFLTLDHAPPTHVVIKTLCWVAFILPSTYWSRFLSKWSSNTERTSSLNGLLINTSTTCTRDVHHGDTLTRDVLCFFESSFTLLVCCTRWTSGIRIFWIFKRIYPCGRNPFLHNLLITPSLFLIHENSEFLFSMIYYIESGTSQTNDSKKENYHQALTHLFSDSLVLQTTISLQVFLDVLLLYTHYIAFVP